MLSDHKIQIPAVNKTLYYIIPLCLTSGLQAKSQPSISSDSTNTQIEQLWEKMYELKGVVVTGTRSPKKLREVPVLTRVITHKDIQKADATNIQDLLQTELPGIEFTYAMNQQVNMNLAGFAGQSILILVDGERLAGETMDNVDFTRLSMADIERIEIVRGAASALYGSNAAGGVINIITRKSKEPWTLHLDARYGEHNQQRYNTILSLRQGIYANRLTFSHTSCDNYQVSNRGTEPQASTFTQVYGDKTFNLSDRMSIDLTKDLLLTGRLQYFYRTTEREEDSQERYRDYQANIKAQWHISPRDHLEASYNFDQYDKSDYLRIQSLDLRKYSNVQNNFRLLYNRQLRQSDILTIGADYLYDYLMNTNLTDSTHTAEPRHLYPIRLAHQRQMRATCSPALRLFLRRSPIAPHPQTRSPMDPPSTSHTKKHIRYGIQSPHPKREILQLRYGRHMDRRRQPNPQPRAQPQHHLQRTIHLQKLRSHPREQLQSSHKQNYHRTPIPQRQHR